MLRHFLLILPATALVARVAQAQPSPARFPFPPTYGLGLPFLNDNQHSLRTMGMGVGMAMYAEPFINDFNPALLPSSSQNLLIDGDLSFWSHSRTYLSPTERAAPLSKFRIPNLRVSYPLLAGRLTLRLGYQAPRIYDFNTRSIELNQRLDQTLPDTLTRIALGASKIRQYSLGAGFTMVPGLTGGLQVDYLTGTFSAASAGRLSRPDTATLATRWTDGGKVTSWRLTGGLFHRLPITRTLILGSGVSVAWALPLNAKGNPTAEGIGTRSAARATTRIPLLVRGGLSVGDDRTWRVGVDASWQRWSAYRSWNGAARYPDAISLAIGGEVTPGGVNAEQFLKRSTYRAGLSFGRQIREELPRTVNELALSAGASFPVTRIEEKRRSYINLALRFGRAVYPDANVYRGGLFEIGVGFMFNSRLYIQVGRGNCPIPSCHVRKRHLHEGQEYSGQPWYKMQNPHIGEKLPYRKPTEKPRSNDKKRFRF